MFVYITKKNVCPPQVTNSLVFLLVKRFVRTHIRMLLKVKLPYDPVCPSVGWSVGRLVCHTFLKGQEVSLPCYYRSTQIPLFHPDAVRKFLNPA